MKKYYVSIAIAMTGILLSYCHGSKKAMASVPKLTYTSDVQAVIAANCTPCHFPAKGGNKKALDTYAAVQENIDDMIRRIELNPADKGFMPFKHPKLSDSTIAIFRKWKSDGMLEK
jgi:hypothetical protein